MQGKIASPSEISADPHIPRPADIKLRRGAESHGRKRSLLLKTVLLTLVCCTAFFFVFTAAMLKTDFRGKLLDGKIQRDLNARLQAYFQTEIRHARLLLDRNLQLAVEMHDIPLHHLRASIQTENIGFVRLGFSTRRLLQGKFHVTRMEVRDAEIILPDEKTPGFPAVLPQAADGRVDFHAVADLLFQSVNQLLEGVDRQEITSLLLKNILLRFQMNGEEKTLSVLHLHLRNLSDSVKFDGKLQWFGQIIGLEGSAERDTLRQVRAFDLAFSSVPVHLGEEEDVAPYLPDGRIDNRHFRVQGSADIRITARHAPDDSPARISAFFSMPEGFTDIGTDRKIPTRLAITAAYSAGKENIEILPSVIALGGVEIPLRGAIHAVPPAEGSVADGSRHHEGSYYFELTAEKAVSAPRESPEDPLLFGLEIAGQFVPEDRRAVFERFLLKTAHGTVTGQGSLRFGEGSPETILALKVPQMPVQEAKQLWPVNIARGARNWVLSNVFSGELLDSTLEITLPGGFFRDDRMPAPLTARELAIRAHLKNFSSDIIGKIPALQEGAGEITVRGTSTEIKLHHGIVHVGDNERLDISEGLMILPWVPFKPLFADLSLRINGAVGTVGKLLSCDPLHAIEKIPFDTADASGDISVLFKLNFPVMKKEQNVGINWDAQVDFRHFSLAKPFRGITTIGDATGSVHINNRIIELRSNGLLNGIPATVEMRLPTTENNAEKQEKIVFHLNDQTRNRFFPAANGFVNGEVTAEIGPESNARRRVVIDLSKATFRIPWLGWKKGSGIAAKIVMTIPADINALKDIVIDDFDLSGDTFQISGKIAVKDGNLAAADFAKISLNRQDRLRLSVKKHNKGYNISLTGQNFDLRSMIRQLGQINSQTGNAEQIRLTARIDNVGGFHGETLTDFSALYSRDSSGNDDLSLEGMTRTKHSVIVRIRRQKGVQSVHASAADAGSLLRFMDFYDKMHAGHLEAKLQSTTGTPMSGPVSISDFHIVNEPRLASIVSTAPSQGGKSLNEAVKGRIDVSQVAIDQAYGQIARGDNYLVLDRGVVRGRTVGATFQGVVYDAAGNISMTGTFMPGYGLNRLFGDVPVLGAILGNGRDRGLIGITFKIEGKVREPRIVVNPISVIAPGIFRSIFEFK